MTLNIKNVSKYFPDLTEILNALEESEKTIKADNERKVKEWERKEPQQRGRKPAALSPMVAKVASFMPENEHTFYNTVFQAKPGKDELLRQVNSVISTKGAIAFRVEVYKNSNTSESNLEMSPVEFQVDSELLKETASERQNMPPMARTSTIVVPVNNSLKGTELKEQMAKEFEEMRAYINSGVINKNADPMGVDSPWMLLLQEKNKYLIAESDFKHQFELAQLKHQAEIDRIKADFEKKEKELKDQIEAKQQEINDLNEELDEASEQLGSINDPKPATEVLTGLLAKAGEKILRNNPKILGAIGIDEETAKNMWNQIDGGKQIEHNGEAASEMVDITDFFAGFEGEHLNYLKATCEFVRQQDLGHLAKLCLFLNTISKDGYIVEDLLNKALKAVRPKEVVKAA